MSGPTLPLTAPSPPPSHMIFARTVDGGAEPVTVNEVKVHAKIENDYEDGLIETYITVARISIEAETHRSLRAETWRGTAERFPERSEDGRYRFRLSPLPSAITSVLVDGVAVSSSLYTLRGDELVLDGTVEGPAGETVTSEVAITFTTGAGSIPAPLLLAIRMMATHLHSNREPIANTWQAQPVPFTFQYLVQPFKPLSIL